MSIEVACHMCGWKGTVDDSVAGERIACRVCGVSLAVPKAKKDEKAPEYDVLGEDKLPQPNAGRVTSD